MSAIGYEDYGFKYAGPFRYRVELGYAFIESSEAAGGRIWCYDENDPDTPAPETRYFITDHLGSTRVVLKGDGTLSMNADYLPYGGLITGGGLNVAENDYLWTGKELQHQLFDTPAYDSSARLLFTNGLFASPDPLAEKYPGISPYAYCAGNPVLFHDPDGMDRQIKTTQNTKVITATFYVNYAKYNGIKTFDAINNAAIFLNNIKGLEYTQDGETYSVSFDITVKHSFRPDKDANYKAGANYIVIDESVDYPKDENGNSILGHADGGKKVTIHNKQLGVMTTILHEMLHCMGAALEKGPDGKFVHEPTGLMAGSVEKQTQEISQQTINDIINKGYAYSCYSNTNSGNTK